MGNAGVSISHKDAMLLGALAQEDFRECGGYTAEQRNEMIESAGEIVHSLQLIQGILLDDTERTMSNVELTTIQLMNSTANLMEAVRKTFIFNAIMLRGGDLMLADLRKGLLERD